MKRYKKLEKEVDIIGNNLKEKDKPFYDSVIEEKYNTQPKASLRKTLRVVFPVCSLLIIVSVSILLPFMLNSTEETVIEYQGQVLYVESTLEEVNDSLIGFNLCISSEDITASRMYDDITGDTLYYQLIYEDYDNFEFFKFYFYVNKYFRDRQYITGDSVDINVDDFSGKYVVSKTFEENECSEVKIEITFGTQDAYILYSSYTEDVSLKVEQILSEIMQKE